MPASSHQQRWMCCSTRYDTCSLPLANRIAHGRSRERPPPRSTTSTQRAPQPAPIGTSAGSGRGHTSGSNTPHRDRPAWSVPHAIAHSGTIEVTSAASGLATQNNGTSSCVRLPDRAEYSSFDNGRVNSGVFADLVMAADQILFESEAPDVASLMRFAQPTPSARRNNRHPPPASQPSQRNVSSGFRRRGNELCRRVPDIPSAQEPSDYVRWVDSSSVTSNADVHRDEGCQDVEQQTCCRSSSR